MLQHENEQTVMVKIFICFTQGRPQMIATYALCGFSNIGTIGIEMGMLGGLCPGKKGLLSTMALRALVAGSITCFLTACVAGNAVLFFLLVSL